MIKKYKILILDDEEGRHSLFRKKYNIHELTHAYTADEAIDYLSKHKYDIVFLDHDLGTRATGIKVAKWMHSNKIDAQVIIHSLNPVGAENMKHILKDARILPGAFL